MTTTVADNPASSRFEITIDGELAGFLDYRKDGDQYAIPHTRVFTRFGGRGVGSTLVREALEEIAERGGTALPYCAFVPRVIRDNPELLEVVPEDQRGAFGL